jgi:predicted metal-dependent hydrolase
MPFQPTDARIDEGIRLFNDRDFFACHDVFEDYWSELTGPEKTFFQGMIHAAVCLHHFEENNLSGARKMYNSFVRYVSSSAPEHCGINVQKLLDDMEACFSELLAVTSGYPHGLTLKQEFMPTIERTTV